MKALYIIIFSVFIIYIYIYKLYRAQDFAKIQISSNNPEEILETTSFVRDDEDHQDKADKIKQPDLKSLELFRKKRIISSQFRCPTCSKIYIGRTKIENHLIKYPDHRSIKLQSEQNDDSSSIYNDNDCQIWNYLIDISRKSPTGQRGSIFCRELTNLLNNLQLMKNSLFKRTTTNSNNNKNLVQVDELLGNVIDLIPGKYRFDESNLLKDLTVFQFRCDKDSSSVVNNNNNNKISNITNNNNNNIKQNINNEQESNNNSNNITAVLNIPSNLILLDTTNNGGSSSDEVINVDQFVNERFQKITEQQDDNTMELTVVPSPTLDNLDLPSMDLFQFGSS